MSNPFVDRFWSKALADGSGCWTWQAAKNKNGYGVVWQDGKTVLAHRVSYELSNGPIRTGFTVDHLCRNRSCINPQHLESVTQKVNVLRGQSLAALNAVKTHCKRGHEFTPANTYQRSDRRECRACAALLRPLR